MNPHWPMFAGARCTSSLLNTVRAGLVCSGMLAALTACTSGSPIPPADFVGLLSADLQLDENAKPADQQQADAVEIDTGESSETVKQTTPALTTKADEPSTQVALAGSTTPLTGSQAAVENAATGASQVPAPKVETAAAEAKAEAAASSKPAPATAIATTTTAAAATVAREPAKPGFFASLFKSNKPKKPKAALSGNTRTRTAARRASGGVNGLPGVRRSVVFGINESEETGTSAQEAIQLASVTNMARRGNFGLLLQTPNVQVHCFPPKLVRILKRVERKYGRTPVVTSGYRSAKKNRRIRGARNSTHITCTAADIQVKGVSKWQLASYLRSLPGRGGVGTYCHTKSVHIDIGKERDWNWRCRRKRRR